MTWQQDFYNKFVHSEYNPSQDNYGEAYLDGDPFELETFITSLLKKQRENCYKNYLHGFSDDKDWDKNAILNAPDE